MRPIAVEQEITEQFLGLGRRERLKFAIVALDTELAKEANFECNADITSGGYRRPHVRQELPSRRQEVFVCANANFRDPACACSWACSALVTF
jgi:hypothetical protein